MSDAGVLASQPLAGLGAILAALSLARKTTVQACEAFEFAAQCLGILNRRAIGTLRECFDAQIDPDGVPSCSRRVRSLLFHLERDEPATRLFGDGGKQDVRLARWQIAAFLQSKPAEPGQVDGFFVDVDGTREPKTAQTFPFGFEAWVASLALPPALLLQPAAAKEVGEGTIEVTQGFLRRALRAFVHPGEVRLLERVEFPVQFHGGDGASHLPVDLLLAFETPVVGESGNTSMLLAGRDLPVSEVQFSFIASRDPHRLLLRTEEVKYESSIEFQYELPQATFFHTLYECAFDHINQLQISSDTAIPEMG